MVSIIIIMFERQAINFKKIMLQKAHQIKQHLCKMKETGTSLKKTDC